MTAHCGIEWVLHPFLADATTTQLIQSKNIVTVAEKQGLNKKKSLNMSSCGTSKNYGYNNFIWMTLLESLLVFLMFQF